MAKTIPELQAMVEDFIKERDWEQFHSDPKNTLIALIIEAAEVMEHFRFTTPEEATKRIAERRSEIEDEMGDVVYNILMFAYQNNIDLEKAFTNKLTKIAKRYPVKKFKGVNKKYNE